jgi:hypothetical protein
VSVRLRAVLPAVLCLPWLSGCLGFSAQSITYSHDAASDTLRVYEQYIGIQGEAEDDPPELTAAEENELLSAWFGEATFLLDPWIDISLDDLRERYRDATPTADAISPAMRSSRRRLAELAASNVRIQNGPFFLDRQGRLCAIQRITVTKVAAIVDAFNEMARLESQDESCDDTRPAAARERAARAAASPLPALALTGNRITVRYPAAADEFDEVASKTTLGRVLSGGGMARVIDGIAVVTFGSLGSERETLEVTLFPTYRPNAVAFVRGRFGLAERFDPADDAARFFAR